MLAAHTDPPVSSTIPLNFFNPAASAINIGGSFQAIPARTRKISHPSGTTLCRRLNIQRGKHVSTPPAAGTPTTSASMVRMATTSGCCKANAQSNLVAFVDHVDFGAARNGESFGRWPNGSNTMYHAHTHVRCGELRPARRPGHHQRVHVSARLRQSRAGVRGVLTPPQAENLTNWKLTGDIDFTFPTTTRSCPQVRRSLCYRSNQPACQRRYLTAFRTLTTASARTAFARRISWFTLTPVAQCGWSSDEPPSN